MAKVYKRTPSGPYWIDYWCDGENIMSLPIRRIKSLRRNALLHDVGDVMQFNLEKVKRSPLFCDFRKHT